MKINLDRKGLSLVELLMGGTLGGMLLYGIISMMGMLNRSNKSAVQTVEFENLVMLIRMALQAPTTCPAALQNASGTPVAPPSTLTVAAPNIPSTGIAVSKISIGTLNLTTTAPYGTLYINNISIRQITAGVPSAASPVPYSTVLRVAGSKTASGTKAAVGGGNLLKDIPLSLTIQTPVPSGPTYIAACNTAGVTSGGGASIPTPPTCTGNNLLHFNGTSWTCDSPATQGGTPCGPGGRGVTMYGTGYGSSNRACCFITDYFGTGLFKNFVDCQAF